MSDLFALEVPFAEKDEAKAMGATWDMELRKWCVPLSQVAAFARWLPYEPTPEEVLSQLCVEVPAEHVRAVQLLSQNCEYRDWLLLMLPEKRWGAFWRDDLDAPAATAIFEGRYDEGCRFIGDSPLQALEYMRQNQVCYTTPEPAYADDRIVVPGDPDSFCQAELRIGGLTIPLFLPGVCGVLAQHVSTDMPLEPGYGELSLAIYQALERSVPDWHKPPSIDDQNRAAEISRSLREPLPAGALENRQACQEFIAKHSDDMTLYRKINRCWYDALHPLTNEIQNYARWTFAREQMARGEDWEVVAASLKIKTKATIERYIANAEEHEREHADWAASPWLQQLLETERAGGSVRDLVLKEVDEQSWAEFRRERRARKLLREAQ
ncbi:DUF5710 domain-containing protein [Geopseudomonas aromaticivorans]